MRKSLSADDVLRDIEFELVQGAISQNELGKGIYEVKRYHNSLRSEVMQDFQRLNDREVIARLFKLNEMMITLLQETVSTIDSLRLDLRKVSRTALEISPSVNSRTVPAVGDVACQDMLEIFDDFTLAELDNRFIDQLEISMGSEVLEVEMNVRGSHIPVIGGLINRLRTAFHELVLFYIKRLAEKQSRVNRIYGDTILNLSEVCANQQEEISILSRQVASLEACLTKHKTDAD